MILTLHMHNKVRRRSVTTIIAELTAQRDRLDRAIAALRGKGNSRLTLAGKLDGRRRTLSAAQRRKITLGMKRRWAERKKQAA
jgi:hypothetical protein